MSKFDIKKWLKDDLGFTDAELTPEFIALMEPRAAKVEQGYLRQADYSRFVNEYKAKSDGLTQEIADWTETQANTAAEVEARREALETLEQEKLVLTQAATRLAEESGLKLEDVLKGVKIETKPPVATVEKFDPTPVYAQVGNVAKYLLDFATELPMIAAEHLALTGEPLNTRALRAEIEARAARKENTSPVEVWEAMYGIGEKRTAKNVADRAAEITAAEARGREAAKSEAAIPGSNPVGTHAPVFANRTSVLQRPQPGRNTAGFAQSLAKGTYRTNPGRPGAR